MKRARLLLADLGDTDAASEPTRMKAQELTSEELLQVLGDQRSEIRLGAGEETREGVLFGNSSGNKKVPEPELMWAFTEASPVLGARACWGVGQARMDSGLPGLFGRASGSAWLGTPLRFPEGSGRQSLAIHSSFLPLSLLPSFLPPSRSPLCLSSHFIITSYF